MSDEPAFLAAIQGTPDNLVRLVYADWLDDLDTAETRARAAFLRAWCELADTPLSDPAFSDRFAHLERLRVGLPDDWLLAVDADRFRPDSPDRAAARAGAFLLRFARTDAQIERVTRDGEDYVVAYTDLAGEFSGSDRFVLRVDGRLRVDAATGRVRDLDGRYQPADYEPPPPGPPPGAPKLVPRDRVTVVSPHADGYSQVVRWRKNFWAKVQMGSVVGIVVGLAALFLTPWVLSGGPMYAVMGAVLLVAFACLTAFLVAIVLG
jgi:uncharacterized protein (TIGR02996 family)